MKTLSLKILGCTAALSLLTTTRAQNADDAQAVPPPDTSVQQQTDTVMPAQQQAPVIVMPVQTDNGGDANGNGNGNGNGNVEQPANGQTMQPMQNMQTMQGAQPMQGTQPNQFRSNGQNQFQNRFNNNNNNGNGRNGRFNRGDNAPQVQQMQRFNSAGDASVFLPPVAGGTNGTDGLILNFRGASIDQVLNYLSDAAGFIIELDAPVRGTVDVFSAHPVSKEEAVQLLDSVLNKNGYTVIQTGRTLRVMRLDDAVHSGIPIIVGNDPDQIPITDVMVTQIIPIRYVSARQLITDLSPLTTARVIIANDAGNSIIVTDTQANIHHMVELVKAIDSSAEDVTVVKSFVLHFHDPVEVANLISQVFADQSQNGGGAAPVRFGGLGGLGGFGGAGGFGAFFGGGAGGGQGGGRGGRGGGGGGGGQGGNQADRIRQHAKVVAVADQRTGSVIVTAPKDMMAQVEELVTEVDKESAKVSRVTVIHLDNADLQEVQKALQPLASSNGRTTQSSQNSALMTRENQNSSSSSSSSSPFGSGGVGGGGGGFGGGGGGGGFGGGGGGRGGGGFGQ